MCYYWTKANSYKVVLNYSSKNKGVTMLNYLLKNKIINQKKFLIVLTVFFVGYINCYAQSKNYNEPHFLNVKLGMTIEEVSKTLATRDIIIDTELYTKESGVRASFTSFRTPIDFVGMKIEYIYMEFSNDKLIYISLHIKNPDYKLRKEFIETYKSKYQFSRISKDDKYFDYDFGGHCGVKNMGHSYDASLYKRSDGITFIEDWQTQMFASGSYEVLALRDEKVVQMLRSQFDSTIRKKMKDEI